MFYTIVPSITAASMTDTRACTPTWHSPTTVLARSTGPLHFVMENWALCGCKPLQQLCGTCKIHFLPLVDKAENFNMHSCRHCRYLWPLFFCLGTLPGGAGEAYSAVFAKNISKTNHGLIHGNLTFILLVTSVTSVDN